jgi:hypothetical protein
MPDQLPSSLMSDPSQAPLPEVPERSTDAPQTSAEALAAAQQVPVEIQTALRDLMRLGERESDFGRRGHFREMLESEEFWKGNQYPIWSEKEFNFRTPWDYAVSQNRLEDQPVYQYVINIYQSYGLTVIAALSQKVPKVRFFPHSTKSEVDIATARAASDVAELIEKNNKLRLMAIREAYLLWTQGAFGTYTRFVRDKKMGMESIPVIEDSTVTLNPDQYLCNFCGTATPAAAAPPPQPMNTPVPPAPGTSQPTTGLSPEMLPRSAQGQLEQPPMAGLQQAPSPADITDTGIGGLGMGEPEPPAAPATGIPCDGCGMRLGDEHFQPMQQAQVPVVSGYKEIPQGFEKMSVYGLLNLKVPPYIQSFDQAGYIQLVEDINQGAIRAAYFGMHRQIGPATAGTGGDSYSSVSASESDTYERVGRMRLHDAQSPYSGLRSAPVTTYITYKRVWMRRWYFMAHEDPNMREQLWNMFPDGAYVAFAGDQFLEARSEDIDDHWTFCAAMPSYGIYSQSIGASTLPLQKQINDAANIVAEHIDFGTAPPVFFDADFISGDALRAQKMRPATFMPVYRARGGSQRSLQELMHQPQIKIDSNIYNYGNSLIELVQVVSGALPSLFGGQLRGNETASAYAQSRDQALGKLSLFWAVVKQHHADTMRLGVECFKKNRTGDAEAVILGKSNDFTSKYIRLADLRGNIRAEPEADEDFPQSWAEIRSNLNEMMQANPAIAQQLWMEPANLALFKKYLGTQAITFSAESNREMQFREIDELLTSPPIPVPMINPMTGQPVIDPTTGQPAIQDYNSTVPPNVHGEDHATHIKSIMEWVADSDGGILAQKMNPDGFANVMAHLLEHKKAMAELAAFEQQLQQMVAAQAAPLQMATAALSEHAKAAGAATGQAAVPQPSPEGGNAAGSAPGAA